jgi:CRISPR-associated protein Cas5h
LGILGGLIGLDGYKNKDTIPEYYRILKDMKVYIKCNSKIDKKFLVKYNSGFLNYRRDSVTPSAMILEQIIFNPDYEIGLLIDESNPIHNRIAENIKNRRSEFPLYLGKNEFLANLDFIQHDDYETNSKNTIKCESVVPFKEIDKGQDNMKLELLPVRYNERFKYVYELMAIPQGEGTITVRNSRNFIASKNKVYYVF